MIRLLNWCWADLKRGLEDLDGNKLMIAPFVFFVALAVLDFSVDSWCHKWPHSLRCSKESIVPHEAAASAR